MKKSFKFRVGQVVNLNTDFYVRISAKHKEYGENFYTVAFDGDKNYDFVSESDLRKLSVREKGGLNSNV